MIFPPIDPTERTRPTFSQMMILYTALCNRGDTANGPLRDAFNVSVARSTRPAGQRRSRHLLDRSNISKLTGWAGSSAALAARERRRSLCCVAMRTTLRDQLVGISRFPQSVANGFTRHRFSEEVALSQIASLIADHFHLVFRLYALRDYQLIQAGA